MTEITFTLVQLTMIIGVAISLALLPGADLAKLALAVLYQKAGISPAYAESVQDGEDVDPSDANNESG